MLFWKMEKVMESSCYLRTKNSPSSMKHWQEKGQTSGTRTISTTRKRLHEFGIYQVLDSRGRDSSWDDTEFPIK
ncbi:hypothetical protein ACS0TY_005333 [Phlomoides rotata]